MSDNKGLPLFYEAPVPLDEARHAGFSLARDRGFGFAARSNIVPLSASEFVHASRHYPIVFSLGEGAAPFALLGLTRDRNDFVGEDGAWAAGTYIPAYLRRYPFILMDGGSADQFLLCVDEASDAVGEGEGQPFFEAGEQTALTREAAQFCAAYQADHALGLQFTNAAADLGLFAEREVTVTVRGEERRVTGFQSIDEQKLASLTDETVLDWHRRGFLALAAHHAASMHAWSDLAQKGAAAGEGS